MSYRETREHFYPNRAGIAFRDEVFDPLLGDHAAFEIRTGLAGMESRRRRIGSSRDVVDLVMGRDGEWVAERATGGHLFVAIHLDAKNGPMNTLRYDVDTDKLLIDPETIIRDAMVGAAVAIIVVRVTPPQSLADYTSDIYAKGVEEIEQLVVLLDLLGLRLLDCVIASPDEGYLSFLDAGLLAEPETRGRRGRP